MRKYAVLIGIDKYHESLGNLKYAGADCHRLKNVLLSGALGFEEDKMLLLDDTQQEDHKPTFANIHTWLSSWLAQPKEDDLVLFYYAGHGRDMDNKSYLIPGDATLSTLHTLGIPLANIQELMGRCKARNKILIIDACHSGAGRDVAPMSVNWQNNFSQSKGIYTITSCGVDELSHEWDEKSQGVFSWFLSEALSGSCTPNADGKLTIERIYEWVHEKVTSWSAQHRCKQTPQRFYQGSGTIVLAGAKPVYKKHIEKEQQYGNRQTIGKIFDNCEVKSANRCLELPKEPVLTEGDIRDVINEWSAKKRFGIFKCLSPLCEYSDLTSINQILMFSFSFRVLTEKRTLSYERKPCPRQVSRDIKPFSGDVWSVSFQTPDDFVDLSQVWTSPNPTSIENCNVCSGVGHLHCDECSGNGIVFVSCKECSGKGRIAHRKAIKCPACKGDPTNHRKINSYGHGVKGCNACVNKGIIAEGFILCLLCKGDPVIHRRINGYGNSVKGCNACNDYGVTGSANEYWEECSKCAGAGRIKKDCDDCAGKGTRHCIDCAGEGKLVSHAIVTSQLKVLEKCLRFPEDGMPEQIQASDWKSLWSGTDINTLPTSLWQGRSNIKREVESTVRELKAGKSVRMLRFNADLFFLPVLACRLKHHGREFEITINGFSRRVLTCGRAPKNLRHAFGVCFGIPVVAFSLADLTVLHLVPFAIVSFAALLLSSGFTLWALFSRPKLH